MRTGLLIGIWGVSAVCLGVVAATTDDTFVRIVDAAVVVAYVALIARAILKRERRGPPSTPDEAP
jgi:hypothetical protein